MTVEDTPDYGTPPQQNVEDAPLGHRYLSAEEIAEAAALAEVQQAALAAANRIPEHAAHLDPNSYNRNRVSKAYGACAVCNQPVVLEMSTVPEWWSTVATPDDWALDPRAPWEHCEQPEQVTGRSLLIGSPDNAHVDFGAIMRGESVWPEKTEYKEQVAAMLNDTPYDSSSPRSSVPDHPNHPGVHEIELARFVRDTPSGPLSIEQKTVTVAEDTLEAARNLALTNNEGWLLVESSVLSSDPVSMSPTASLPVVYADGAAMQPPVVTYDEPNIVSVSDDDTEHPREDPHAVTAEGDTTEGDR